MGIRSIVVPVSSRTLVGTSSMRASAMVSIPMNCARGSVFIVLGGMTFSFLFGLTGGAGKGWFPASLFPKVSAHHTDGVCGGSSFLMRSTVCWLGLTLLVGPCSGCLTSRCCVMMCWGPVLSLLILQIPLAYLKNDLGHTWDILGLSIGDPLAHNGSICQ